MNILKVYIWGEELGRLSYNPSVRLCYFTFNPELNGNCPDISPILLPMKYRTRNQIAYGDDRKIYQNLPPFIADSLPDSWGNTLFEQWAKTNKLSPNKLSPLYKLMFIGKRAMGALEFEPAVENLAHTRKIDIKALHDLSLKILHNRESISIKPDEELTLQTLLAVGTSAGGRQMKAIIAVDRETGQIRSGQIGGLAGYDYCILKFEDDNLPTSEIEMAYHDLAVACGIEMEDCRLINVDGCNHFLTRRFDRRNGQKIHMQTLAAINPDATSYEDLFTTCRELDLSDREIEEVYRRLVFNVLSNNTDDHNKNFSFLLEKGGKWRLSPAYDLTFIFNRFGTGPETHHCLSVAGRYRDITKEMLLEIGKENGIRMPEKVLARTAKVLEQFPELAKRYSIDSQWANIIKSAIKDNLSQLGYMDTSSRHTNLYDTNGRVFSDIQMTVNNRGYYVLSVAINGTAKRRFIRPDMSLYTLLRTVQFEELSEEKQMSILEELFPV